MSGQFEFGNYVYKAFLCVSHYFAHLLLGVETAVKAVDGRFVKSVYQVLISAVAECGIFGKLGVTFYLNSPALVLGQVPMELVQLEHCHHVELFPYRLDCLEVTAHVG